MFKSIIRFIDDHAMTIWFTTLGVLALAGIAFGTYAQLSGW